MTRISSSYPRDHKLLEKRRLQAAKLFDKGWKVSAVGKHLGATKQAAHQWYKLWKTTGTTALASKGKPGRKAKLTQQDRDVLVNALLAGAEAHGYPTALWTLPRVAQVITKLTGKSHHP